MQGTALALRARAVERGPLLFCQQRVDVMSGSAEMDPAEGESLTAAAVGEQSEVSLSRTSCGLLKSFRD
jgi:hypothetical protein